MDATETFSDSFTPLWKRASQYLVDVAEVMPDSLYDYKPVNDVFSFEEHLLHLADNMLWLSTDKIMEQPYSRVALTEVPVGKEEVIRKLKNAIAHVNTTIQSFDESKLSDQLNFGGEVVDKEHIFYLIRDHVTHHRAQAIIYLRLNGIKPPKYVGW